MNALRDGVQRVNDEAGGMLELQVVQRTDLQSLILAALAGSSEAAQTLRLVNDTVANIKAAPRRRRMLCGACPRGLRGGQFSVVIAQPACDDPTQGLAMAICAKCGPNFDAIQEEAAVALARIWPDLRPVTITHPVGGRA